MGGMSPALPVLACLTICLALPVLACLTICVVWLCSCVVAWLCGCVVVWLCGCVVVWLCGCVVAWLRGCVVMWCGCVVAWLRGCMCGCVVVHFHLHPFIILLLRSFFLLYISNSVAIFCDSVCN